VLADNGLTEVSSRMGRLDKLRMLDLRHNQLTRVPDAVGDVRAVTDFFVPARQPTRGRGSRSSIYDG